MYNGSNNNQMTMKSESTENTDKSQYGELKITIVGYAQ